MMHEIRNLLGALTLHTDLLIEECQQMATTLHMPVPEAVADIKTALTCLHETVEDYRSLVRLQAPQRTEANLGMLVTAVAQEMQGACATRGITLSVEGLAAFGTVWVHQGQIRRVLLNLMQNAMEAMPAGGALCLRGQRTAAHVILAVCDTGHGIPAVQLPQLFTPWHTTKPNGTGLGLYIAREITKAHGGTLTVQSAPGQGTTCTITLPAPSEALSVPLL
jgi:signal transduction histidine kinase